MNVHMMVPLAQYREQPLSAAGVATGAAAEGSRKRSFMEQPLLERLAQHREQTLSATMGYWTST